MDRQPEIENIEELRRSVGIDDVDLRGAIRALHVGDFVRLTLLGGESTGGGETLPVRITRIRGSEFRGRLAARPASRALARLRVGAPLAFTAAHIHSLAEQRATRGR